MTDRGRQAPSRDLHQLLAEWRRRADGHIAYRDAPSTPPYEIDVSNARASILLLCAAELEADLRADAAPQEPR